jgi:putative membrane protein insertion efficiency factor
MAYTTKMLRTSAERIAGRLVCAAIDLYRIIISPLIVAHAGPACRFEPTCSAYAREAIAEYGPWRGGWMAIRRVMRCRPAGGWGYDPVRHRMNDAGTA